MLLREITAKSIISKSNLPDSDFVINPYVGCMHSCVYCYARFMKRFTGHKEEWGSFIDVKTNAAELIPKYTEKFKGKSIFMSSVTDPYFPIERKYQLTRKILENLIPLQPNLGMQTKSDLVLRDIDLLKQFRQCEVGLTITTLDDSIRKEVEPFTSPVHDRIKALEKLKESKIRTYVFIGPIFPSITDWKKIIIETRHCADFYMFENLNVKGTIWESVKRWLQEKHPELIPEYERIYFSKSSYWDDVEQEIRRYCNDSNIAHKIFFHHGK
jgi:DNA repair photolyase